MSSLRTCPSCAGQVDVDDRFCERCGTSLERMPATASSACPSCGGTVTAGDRYCEQCGADLRSVEKPRTDLRSAEKPRATEAPTPIRVPERSEPAPTGLRPAERPVETLMPPLEQPVTNVAAREEVPAALWPEPEKPSAQASGLPVAGQLESMPGTGLDAVTGEAVPNATYLGQRLLYEKPPEDPFDPLTGFRFLLELGKHALIFAVIWGIGTFAILVLIASTIKSGRALGIVWNLWSAALALAYWLRPIPVLLSEWKFSVDDQAGVAPKAFEHIAWALKRRKTPVSSMRVRRLKFGRGEAREYLELREGIFAGFVSAFPYGNDLYIGWTFWWFLSPLRFFGMFLARLLQTLRLRGSELYLTLRYDSAKAMREAMHGAAREGIDVAVGAVAAQGHGTIGSEIPVVDFEIPQPPLRLPS